MLEQLISFLEEQLFLSSQSISFALARSSQSYTILPIVLLQYGFITLKELELIFDWLEVHNSFSSDFEA